MTDTSTASPRPWKLAGDTIRDAKDGVVVSAINPCDRATRRLIVDAVNAHGEDAKYIQHLKELLAASNTERDNERAYADQLLKEKSEIQMELIAADVERDRLRDLVRRLANLAGTALVDSNAGNAFIRAGMDFVREARAAIWEGEP